MSRFPQDRGPLYTLEQVGERTEIHPMLLQSYLRSAAYRVPTVWVAGEERYPREALAAFREIHEEAQLASAPRHAAPPAGDAPNWGRRRLLSLTAQRRSGERDAAARQTGAREAAERHAAGNGAARSGEAADNGAVGNGAVAGDPRETGADGRGEPAEASARPAVPADGAASPVAARPGEDSRPEPRRPSRPLYTLQQVHEHTGIPYPVLALYAASESARIPAAGERYAPLYPWEALAVFCRIHQERNPSWQAPSLPVAPPAEEDAASRELSARLERLERAQTDLAEQIRRLLAEDDSYLTATYRATHA